MDALNPIASSSAGTPLAGKSVTTSNSNSEFALKLNSGGIQDTLETGDREADGREAISIQREANGEPQGMQKPTEDNRGEILDLEC